MRLPAVVCSISLLLLPSVQASSTLDGLRLFLSPEQRGATAPVDAQPRPRLPVRVAPVATAPPSPGDTTPGHAVVRGARGVHYIVDGIPVQSP